MTRVLPKFARVLPVLPVLGAAALIAACADDPSAPGRAVQFSSIAGDDATYLIRFQRNAANVLSARVASLGGAVIFAHSGAGVGAVTGLSSAAAAKLAAIPGITSVVEDAYTLIRPSETQLASIDHALLSPANPTTAVIFPRQWNMRVISANVAWAAGKLGSSAVKVGILDTGLDYTNFDLSGRVDLTLSRSFLSAAENQRVQTAFPGAHPVADLHYHGTHVGATVASNALIAAGVTSGVRLVGLKVCVPGFPNANPNLAWQASCAASAVLQAMLYAADNGIPIINMSLGGPFQRRASPDREDREPGDAKGGFGPTFQAIIAQVFGYVDRQGTLIIVAAGNSATDMDNDGNSANAYCDAPHAICVSATGPTAGALNGPWTNVDAFAYYSNYGEAVDIAAPGGNATSAGTFPIWAVCSHFSLVIPACQSGIFVIGALGTSSAAPHASGVAALIASEGITGPTAIAEQLQSTVDDLGVAGPDPQYGNGRINAARAVGLL